MKSLTTFLLLAVATLVLSPSTPAPAAAQDGPAARVPRGRRGERVIRLPGWVFVGDPHKPSAYYILERSSVGAETLELRTSFVPEIVRTLERPPF